jgi:hypothetical protein
MVTASAAMTAFGVIELIVFVSWGLLLTLLIGILVYVTLLRGRRQRSRRGASGAAYAAAAAHADPRLPGRLAELRRADPHFDEHLLREAAQMTCLAMFAAMSTGDEQALRWMTTDSFWRTLFGRYIRTSARDARLRRMTGGGGASGREPARQARLPVDFQASAPELLELELGGPGHGGPGDGGPGDGGQQRARVRVSFSQLLAVVAPGAATQTAMASATSLPSLAASFGGAVGERLNNPVAGLSWLSGAGRYDLDFVRPADTQTDPGAALASRTCAACGAAYRSEFAVACAHCRAERPVPWGQWRLSQITAVE